MHHAASLIDSQNSSAATSVSSDQRHQVPPLPTGVDRTLLAGVSPLTGLAAALLTSATVWSTVRKPPPAPPASLSHLSVIVSPSDSKSRKSTGGQEIRHCCFASFYKESIGKTSLIHKSNLGFEPQSEGESNWVVANNWISCCLVLREEGRKKKMSVKENKRGRGALSLWCCTH